MRVCSSGNLGMGRKGAAVFHKTLKNFLALKICGRKTLIKGPWKLKRKKSTGLCIKCKQKELVFGLLIILQSTQEHKFRGQIF